MNVKLSLSQFIIPKCPLIKSKESWDEYVNMSFESNLFCLDRFTHRYYSEEAVNALRNMYSSIKSKIVEKNPNDEITLELLHETSYSGLPYQLYLSYLEKDDRVKIYFDGFLVFITIEKDIGDIDEINIHDIIKLTNSALSFRNDNLKLVKNIFEFDVYNFHNPFWDVEISNLSSFLNLNYTDADYPAFKMLCNDRNYATFTNYGDKQENTIGKQYYVYFSENINKTREKICHDIIIEHELDDFKKFLNLKTYSIISANTKLIESLKSVPSGVHHFFSRHKSWLALKGISFELLTIYTMLPKYKTTIQIISERVKHKTSYINSMQVLILVSDDKYCNQREVESFFELIHDETSQRGFKIENKEASLPPYSYITKELKKEVKLLDKNLTKTMETLNKTISLYSTNFGFDALWVAIATLLITIIPLLIAA